MLHDELQDAYRPQRRYRRHDFTKHEDEETRVHLTILEYGRLVVVCQCVSWHGLCLC